MQASRQSSPAQGDCRDAFFAFLGSSFSLQRIKSSMEVFSPKGSRGASGKPPCRVRRREIPCNEKDQHRSRLSMLVGRAHLARQCASGRKSKLGGASEDAQNYNRCAESASLFSARVAELRAFPLLVARQTVGALPQTLPEALPLDSARGKRKRDEVSPLTPPRD